MKRQKWDETCKVAINNTVCYRLEIPVISKIYHLQIETEGKLREYVCKLCVYEIFMCNEIAMFGMAIKPLHHMDNVMQNVSN